MCSLVAYAVLAAFGHYGITTILACEGVTMLSVLALWAVAAARRVPGAGWMIAALAASIVAGCMRALPQRATAIIGLDPTSLYHVVQIPAIVLLYAALVRRSGRIDADIWAPDRLESETIRAQNAH
jgi:hypothetical protein